MQINYHQPQIVFLYFNAAAVHQYGVLSGRTVHVGYLLTLYRTFPNCLIHLVATRSLNMPQQRTHCHVVIAISHTAETCPVSADPSEL